MRTALDDYGPCALSFNPKGGEWWLTDVSLSLENVVGKVKVPVTFDGQFRHRFSGVQREQKKKKQSVGKKDARMGRGSPSYETQHLGEKGGGDEM